MTENWKRRRAVWTLIFAAAPFLIAAFAVWDFNVARWDIGCRGIVGFLSAFFGLCSFSYPGHRSRSW